MAADSNVVSISLSADLVSLINNLARREKRTRDDLLRQAIRQYAVSRQRWRELQKYGREQARQRGIRQTDVERVIDEYRREVRR